MRDRAKTTEYLASAIIVFSFVPSASETYSLGEFSTTRSPVLDMELMCAGLAIDMENFAFNAGSSKHGNAFLASVG